MSLCRFVAAVPGVGPDDPPLAQPGDAGEVIAAERTRFTGFEEIVRVRVRRTGASFWIQPSGILEPVDDGYAEAA